MSFAKPPWILEGPTRGIKTLTDYYTIRSQRPIAYLHTDMFSPSDGAIDRGNARLIVAAPQMVTLLAASLRNLHDPRLEREIALLLAQIHIEREENTR